MTSEYLDSRRRRRPKRTRYAPFNVSPLTPERGELEELHIRQAYDLEERLRRQAEIVKGEAPK